MKNFFKLFGNLNQDRRLKGSLLIIALVAVIGFSIAACSDDGGEDKRADLIGTWVKDGGSNSETIWYGGRIGHDNDPISLTKRDMGYTEYYSGKLVSYDGTTVKAGDSHSAYSPITFTAKIEGDKLTVSGLSTVDNIDLSSFNGTYTKESDE